MKKIKELWNRLFGIKSSPVPAPAPIAKTPTFVDNFSSLDPTKWQVSTWTAPGANPTHKGVFSADHVYIQDGMLCLKLSQFLNADGTFSSVGGEIATLQKFGYGTYEFVVRASSTSSTSIGQGKPVSGSITGCFNYLPNSETEIDVEVEGGVRSSWTQFTSWISESKPNQTQTLTSVSAAETPEAEFFTYKFVWSRGSIVFYRDNMVVATFTSVVPTQPAPFLFNHWGTNNPLWGGPATPGQDRYMWIKSFSFTPL